MIVMLTKIISSCVQVRVYAHLHRLQEIRLSMLRVSFKTHFMYFLELRIFSTSLVWNISWVDRIWLELVFFFPPQLCMLTQGHSQKLPEFDYVIEFYWCDFRSGARKCVWNVMFNIAKSITENQVVLPYLIYSIHSADTDNFPRQNTQHFFGR